MQRVADGMKAVLQFRAGGEFCRQLAAVVPQWLSVRVVDERDTATFSAEMTDANVLLHVLEPVTDAVMARAPKLQLVQKIGVGVNTIDLAAARQRGIRVANMPGTNSQAVAEHTLALMLATLRRVVELHHATISGRSTEVPADFYDGVGEIGGRTVGLVGYGEVPRRLAPVLVALGARVIYASRTPKAGASGVRRTLDELLSEADIVSLHVPVQPGMPPLLGADAIRQMKPGSILINTARGTLVDEIALEAALRAGRLRAAGLDVLAREPARTADPLLALPNVVATPHIAWLTPETLARSLVVAIENCRRLRDGVGLLHQVTA